MSLKVITRPTEIITAAEAAAFLRLDSYTSEQTLLESMISAARQWVEEYLRRAIGIQTLQLALDGFPLVGNRAILLRPPVVSVTSIKYLDASNVEQTLVFNTDYYLSLKTEPVEVRPCSAWPVALHAADSVRVVYQAGYQDNDSPIVSEVLPSTIRQAILMQVADLYEHREAQTERPLSINYTLERLLSLYRLEMGE